MSTIPIYAYVWKTIYFIILNKRAVVFEQHYIYATHPRRPLPIRDYFGFSHALHLLPEVFRNSFLLRRNDFKIIYIGRTIPTLTIPLHLFLNLLAKNGNKDVPIRYYLGFSHAFHLLPAIFQNSLGCR